VGIPRLAVVVSAMRGVSRLSFLLAEKRVRAAPTLVSCSRSRERDEPDDLLCSRNARLKKALVGRAQWKINQAPSLKERTSEFGWIICSLVRRPHVYQHGCLSRRGKASELGRTILLGGGAAKPSFCSQRPRDETVESYTELYKTPREYDSEPNREEITWT
jgi:hypothetical protein